MVHGALCIVFLFGSRHGFGLFFSTLQDGDQLAFDMEAFAAECMQLGHGVLEGAAVDPRALDAARARALHHDGDHLGFLARAARVLVRERDAVHEEGHGGAAAGRVARAPARRLRLLARKG